MSRRRRKPNSVTVNLAAPHTHAGRDYQAGDALTVRPALVPVLERLGVVGPDPTEQLDDPAPEPDEQEATDDEQ